MALKSHTTPDRPDRTWVPYFVLVVGILATALATYYVALTVESRDRLRFQSAVEHTRTLIQNRMETYISILRSTSALFVASKPVSREEFHAYVERLELAK